MKFKGTGFTLVEVLVVVAVLSLVGVLVVAIFTNTLRGSNKSQITLAIKQNGQAVLENMDKTIRNSNEVICLGNNSNNTIQTIVVMDKKGAYIRYTLLTDPSKNTNGAIYQDNPVKSDDQAFESFKEEVCRIINVNSLFSPAVLTDTRLQSGVRVVGGSFKKDPTTEFKEVITIEFTLEPGVKAPPFLTGQIDPSTFQTSVELR